MSSCCPISGNFSSKDAAFNTFASKSGTVCKLCVSDLVVSNSLTVINGIPVTICANHPLNTDPATTCVEISPGFCGSILQNINGAWGIYRSPGMLEVTVGAGGDGVPPGANFPTVAAAIGQSLITNCRFIRVTDNVIDGNLILPANTVIYVDPGVTWSAGSIAVAGGGSLTLRGSGNSQLAITGLISGAAELNLFDINGDIVGISGVANVYVRDCVLQCTTNNFATGAGQLTIHNSTVNLTGVALTTSSTNVELERMILGYTGGVANLTLLSGYTYAEVDDLKFTGPTSASFLLDQGSFSEVRDEIGGLLSIQITTSLTAAVREINGFLNGNEILSTTVSGLLNNVIIRGAKCLRMIGAFAQVYDNVVLNDVEFTTPVVSVFEPAFTNSRLNNIRLSPSILWNWYLWNNVVATNIQVGNIGSYLSGGLTNVHVSNVSCTDLLLGTPTVMCNFGNIRCSGAMSANIGSSTNEGSSWHDVIVGTSLTFSATGANPGHLKFSNLTVYGIIDTAGASTADLEITNCVCGNIDFGLVGTAHFRPRLTNLTILSSPFLVTANSGQFTNVTCGVITVSSDYNTFTNLHSSNLTVTGSNNKFNGIKSGVQFTGVGMSNFSVTGSRNHFSDLIIQGDLGGVAQTFSVTGNHNKFTNIQLGDADVPTDTFAYGGGNTRAGSTVTLSGSNNHYCNFWVVPKANSVVPNPPGPDLAAQNLITLAGTFNHYINCVFYRDDTNFPLVLPSPNPPFVVAFANQSVDVTGANDCCFNNCRVGPNVFPSGIAVGAEGTFLNAVGSRNLYVSNRTATNVIVNPGAGSASNITY